jgi:hypothetical protein
MEWKPKRLPHPISPKGHLIPSYNLGLKKEKTQQKRKAQVWEPCLFPQLFYYFIYFRVLEKVELNLSRNTKKIVLLGEVCIWICVCSLCLESYLNLCLEPNFFSMLGGFWCSESFMMIVYDHVFLLCLFL